MEITIVIAVVVVVVVALIALWTIRAARKLKRQRSELDRDRAAIEVLLKERNDQIPRLVQTYRSYLGENRGMLGRIAEARRAYQGAGTPQEKAAADLLITQALRALYTEASRSAELKSNTTFVQLQAQLAEIEERVAERRETFNEDVQRFNRRIGRAPGKWLASISHARPLAPFDPGA